MIFVAAFYVLPSLYLAYLLITQGPSALGI
jgi:hypothetical protein